MATADLANGRCEGQPASRCGCRRGLRARTEHVGERPPSTWDRRGGGPRPPLPCTRRAGRPRLGARHPLRPTTTTHLGTQPPGPEWPSLGLASSPPTCRPSRGRAALGGVRSALGRSLRRSRPHRHDPGVHAQPRRVGPSAQPGWVDFGRGEIPPQLGVPMLDALARAQVAGGGHSPAGLVAPWIVDRFISDRHFAERVLGFFGSRPDLVRQVFSTTEGWNRVTRLVSPRADPTDPPRSLLRGCVPEAAGGPVSEPARRGEAGNRAPTGRTCHR